MKLLLDENLPHQLRNEIPGHDCFTVAYMGWGGVENGALLKLAASHGFEALLTKDANIEYEQNLTELPMAVVVVKAASNDMDNIRPLCDRCYKRYRDCRQSASPKFRNVPHEIHCAIPAALVAGMLV